MSPTTPVEMGTFPRHAEFCAAFLPDPEHEDCALACDCGLDEMRRDLKAAQARSEGLEEALRKIERVYERTMPGPRDALRDRVLEITAAALETKRND